MPTDEQALLLQVSADVSRLEKQMAKAVAIVNDGSGKMETRAKKAAQHIEGSFTGEGFAKALDKIFDSSRLTVMEEGAAKLRIFGSALEPLGALGISAAAGVFALAVAAESVKKAMEEVGRLKIESDKTGVPVEALQELQFAAKESHVSVEALNGALLSLNDVLGRLRLNMGAARLQKLADVLGLTPADLAGVRNANDLLPILADHIKALPTLSDQYAAAAKAGVSEILPLLLKGGDGVRELQAEYRRLGLEVSGTVADQIAAGNLEMEKAHDIAHDKLRNSLIELGPLLVSLSTGWDTFAAHAIDALTATASAYDKFVQRAAKLANQDTGNGFADFGANLLGRFNLAVARPTTTMMAVLGSGQAQREALYGPSGVPAAHAAASAAAGMPHGLTPAQLAAELLAKTKLDELEAKYLTHTTNRLEAEKKIEEINAKRVAAGDKPIDAATEKRILDAASAQDAKPGQHAADAAKRKAEAAELKAKEQSARQTQEIDTAEKAELAARLALTTNIADQAKLRQSEIDQDTKKANDKVASDLNEKKINFATATRLRALNDAAAAEKKQLIADQLAQQQAETALQITEVGLGARIAILTAEKDMALTAVKRRELDQIILKIQQDEERARLEAVLASKTATDAQKAVAAAQLASLPGVHQAQARALAHQDLGPVDQYIEQVQDLNKLFQGDAVSAVQSFSSGLADAIVNAKSFGDVVSSVFRQLLAQMLSQSIEKSLAPALLAAFGLPGFAGGTDFAPGGLAVVGERGPELVHLPRGSQVVPNSSFANGVRGGSTVIQQIFHLDGAVTTDALMAHIDNVSARAAMGAVGVAKSETLKALRAGSANRLGR